MVKALAIGAHPDDIEYGCGGVLQRFASLGIVVTNGGAGGSADQRIKELEQSSSIVGYQLQLLNHLDRKVDLNQAINSLEKAIASFAPAIVFVHHEDDLHQDHRTVAQAALSALRGWSGTILFYRTPSTRNFNPNVFVELAEDEWLKKLSSLQIHKSQSDLPYMRDQALIRAFHFWPDLYRNPDAAAEPFVLFRAVFKKGDHHGAMSHLRFYRRKV